MLSCENYSFRGRRAIRLANDLIEVLLLLGGGHVARMSFLDLNLNPLWEPPWATMEPEEYDPKRNPEYGPSEGRLLASLAGHSLCLDHFGDLSPARLRPAAISTVRLQTCPGRLLVGTFNSTPPA